MLAPDVKLFSHRHGRKSILENFGRFHFHVYFCFMFLALEHTKDGRFCTILNRGEFSKILHNLSFVRELEARETGKPVCVRNSNCLFSIHLALNSMGRTRSKAETLRNSEFSSARLVPLSSISHIFSAFSVSSSLSPGGISIFNKNTKLSISKKMFPKKGILRSESLHR